MDYVHRYLDDDELKTRLRQFVAFAAFAIRSYNTRTDYDPNALRRCPHCFWPDWAAMIQIISFADHIDDAAKVTAMTHILDAILEHPDIHMSKSYPTIAIYAIHGAGVQFTDPSELGDLFEQHFGDRLRRAHAQRLWGKVRLWRFTTWWWTTACEAQYAPGEAGCLREKDMCRDTMEEICNKRARFA